MITRTIQRINTMSDMYNNPFKTFEKKVDSPPAEVADANVGTDPMACRGIFKILR